MTRETLLTLMILLALVCLGLLAWAWWRRARRDAAYPAPFAELPEGARTTAVFTAFYVATTRHGEPLERLAIRGLGFRARAELTVTDKGVALDIPGQARMVFDASRLVDAAQATVAIDRVVERDGLARLTWRPDETTLVDSYFRPQDASALQLADAIRPLLPTGKA